MSVDRNYDDFNLPPVDLNSDRLVSDALCARLMGISLSTLRRMDSFGQAPPKIKISQRRNGRRLRDISKFIAERGSS
jgi:hypothetical protein